MNRPPNTPPNSDLDGVRQDERPNVDTANEAGQDTSDLERARKHSSGRPPFSDPHGSSDDRSEG